MYAEYEELEPDHLTSLEGRIKTQTDPIANMLSKLDEKSSKFNTKVDKAVKDIILAQDKLDNKFERIIEKLD